MKRTQELHNLGRSRWLDNITREHVNSTSMLIHAYRKFKETV
jgi:hypothetical protein